MPYRRTYERIILNVPASVITNDGKELDLVLRDLSAEGAGVIGNLCLMENKKVTVQINAPAFFKEPVSKEARVVWCKEVDNNLWRTGLEFGWDKRIDFDNITQKEKKNE
jgi:hypothetical protein